MSDKKIITIIVSFFFLFTCMLQPIKVGASSETSDNSNNEQIISTVTEYYDDGSYTVTIISAANLRSSSVTGSKTSTHYDSSHNKLYGLKVYGTFSYNGSTVTCSSKSYQTFIYDSDWTVENVTTSQSGSGTTKASAKASGTAKRHFLGLTIQTASISVTVYCDKDGNIS